MKEEREPQCVRVWEATVKNSEGVYDFLYFAAENEKLARRRATDEGEELVSIQELSPEGVALN